MKKIWLLFFLVFMWTGLRAQSLAQWTFENITSAVPSTPIEASSKSWKLRRAVASISGGNNNGSPDACSGVETWSTNFWPTGNLSSSHFLEFEATANAGYDLSVSGFFFRSNISSSSGARAFQVYYSTDGFRSSNQYLGQGSNPTGSCSTFSYNLNAKTSGGGTISFRIYPYGQDPAALAASMRIDNVTILGSALLPVELTEWTGTAGEEGIWLSWVTASEQNSDHFVVERRTDLSGFEAITQRKAQGNSLSSTVYEVLDAFPAAGTNYYRLKQVDRDGTFEYSDVIAVDYRPLEQVRVFPTLAEVSLLVDLSGLVSSSVRLYITNLSGLRVWERRLSEPAGIHRLDVSRLNKGGYVLVVETAKGRVSKRFFKR